MSLDERFSHKCSLIKRYLIRFADRPVLNQMNQISYAFWAYYSQCLCLFCTAKASLRPPLHHAICSLVWAHGISTPGMISMISMGTPGMILRGKAITASIIAPGKTLVKSFGKWSDFPFIWKQEHKTKISSLKMSITFAILNQKAVHKLPWREYTIPFIMCSKCNRWTLVTLQPNMSFSYILWINSIDNKNQTRRVSSYSNVKEWFSIAILKNSNLTANVHLHTSVLCWNT